METWINHTQEDMVCLHQSDLMQPGYAISTHNRSSRRGEIALLYMDYIEVKKIAGQHLHRI